MESLIKEHKEKFGVEPYAIGMFWNRPNEKESLLIKSIKENIAYNEHEMLSKEEQDAFNNGELLF